MSLHRSLVFLALAFVVACGGDEDTRFSDTDAAVKAAGGQGGASGSGTGGSGGESGHGGSASDGGSSGTAGGQQDATAPEPDSPDSDATDAGIDPTADAGAGGMAGDGAASAADAGVDGCARPTVYYGDKDKDGHGSASTSIVACSPPATGTWVLTSTDCNDSDSRVHPGQAAYFEVGYRAASGATSFDYDCSGTEDDDPSQTKAPMNCGLLSLALCAGSGYKETPRVGQGLSAYCGSKELGTCRAALGILLCENVIEVTDKPFRCR